MHLRHDDQLAGNVIINADGRRHKLDNHNNVPGRLSDYIIGENDTVLRSDQEIDKGRKQTMEVLRDVFNSKGTRPFDILGRGARKVNRSQVRELKSWLDGIKQVDA